ncbi:TMEM165/GDT1 family protein [Virgifigura deserti]|uniref:TMEM165/GDT1 family protein n=1 Tax=Virgifigura deserti TaxID=2268457 RepID=UPI003CCC1CA3
MAFEFLIFEPFLVSTGVVALAEVGDKTQLLSMCLAARFRRPVPIILGIFFATILNHFGAGLAGTVVGALLEGPWMRWVLGLSFLAVAVWALIPDKLEDDGPKGHWGAFCATAITFFFAEMGDKTQIATVALAAQYQAVVLVTLGTTLGMMIANVPAVLFGNGLAGSLPLKAIRSAAAGVFALLGILALAGVGT